MNAVRRWSRAEYDRLIEVGVFHPGEPVELLGGELIVSEPQGSAHYTAILLVEDALRAALGPGWLVRTQGPVALDDESEPEPDLTVVREARGTIAASTPRGPLSSSRSRSRAERTTASTRAASTPGPVSTTTGS